MHCYSTTPAQKISINRILSDLNLLNSIYTTQQTRTKKDSIMLIYKQIGSFNMNLFCTFTYLSQGRMKSNFKY